MRKYKSSLILVFTAVVLILCGMLPSIVAKVVDDLTDEKIYYEDMKTVQLFRKLNDTEKMYLLKSGTVATISEERTKLKSENMGEMVETALAPYLEQEFIRGNVGDFSLECEPLLYYSNIESNLSGIFWKIRMELWDDLGQTIQLYLDDETGKVLLIWYECSEPIYEREFLKEYVELLFANYQATMDWFEYEESVEEENPEHKRLYSMTYRIGDLIFGEISIKCVVNESGFSIYIESFDADMMQR